MLTFILHSRYNCKYWLHWLVLSIYLSHNYDFFMALQSEPQWKQFFANVGIIDDAISTTYARLFVDNRINKSSLSHMDKDTLTKLGVTVIGHRLSILNHTRVGKTSHPHSMPAVTKASFSTKLITLTPEMTHPQFRKFKLIGM